MPAALEAHELYRFYHAQEDETLALRGVSLTLEPGEIVAIIGPSGSGKSTLLNCLSGVDEPDGGWVAVMGERLSHRSESWRARLRARQIGIVMQSGNLLQDLTVRWNLLLTMTLADGARNDRASDLLGELGLEQRADALPAQLSGGEAARAALAVALVNDPAVVLADEPTGELDAENEAQVLALLRKRADAGGAVMVVTHNPAMAAAADRTLHLVDGQIRRG
jgi:putative ABC transport system ATP-binding protein